MKLASGDGSGAGLVGRYRLSVITCIGRAFLDGLGAMGEAGVNQALPIIHQELGQTMAFCAHQPLGTVGRGILLPGTAPT